MVQANGQPEKFSMDRMGKGKISTQSSFPATVVKRCRKPQKGKLRWYLIIGASVLMTIIIVIVVALAVHFTQGSDDKENLENNNQNANSLKGFTGATIKPGIPQTGSAMTGTTPPTTTSATMPTGPVVTFQSSTLSGKDNRLTLSCEALNVMNWVDLHIIRHHDNKHYTTAIVTSGIQYPSVSVLDMTFSSQLSFKNDAVAFDLVTDDIYCKECRNYSCTVRTPSTYYTDFTYVKEEVSQPDLKLPYSIVEGKNITLECSVSVLHQNASLKWMIKPPGVDRFFDLNVDSVEKETSRNCSKTLTSKLEFLPRSSDNGSYFRCFLEATNSTGDIVATSQTDKEFLVIPSNFCVGKRVYTVHTHPHSPCRLVVYCFQTGPLVYQINCDQGYCYDKDRSQCVKDNSSNTR